ncbi:MAG: type II toxin-antitoxin system death-on-curing family toxin [Anaerolineae bacterium]|nr:type II toxin-antitoxin system death-on-curing family toxin [Anaerolineae bacterium]
MAGIRYLELAEVIALHALIMERTGASPASLRSESQLEAALMRAPMAAHYEEADLVRQAVLLAVGISQAQAFLDGNKRTGFAAMDVFLRLNGQRFNGDSIGLAQHLETIASEQQQRRAAIDAFEQWLRSHLESI